MRLPTNFWVLVRAFLAAAFLCGPVQAQQFSVTQAYDLGETALKVGQYSNALAIATVLLEHDPASYRALMMLTAAQLGLGNNAAAVQAARRAFNVAPDPEQRVIAARLAATALFRAGQYTRSEWWLRRAMNNANTVESARAVRQEFAQVRADNPLSINLSFSIAPNNNINNGSANDTLEIWGLPFVLSADARALSGIEIAAGVNLGYRVGKAANHETSVGLQLFRRTYRLSDSASAAAPDVKGEDYAFAVAELSLSHVRKFAALGGPTRVILATGQNWYGGDPYTRYHRLSLQQVFPLGQSTVLNALGGFEWQDDLQSDNSTSRHYEIGLDLTQQLANGDAVTLSLERSNTWADNNLNEYTGQRVGLRYAFARPVLGTRLSLSYGAERRDYPLSIYDPAGRDDLTLTASANMLFFNIDYLGFSPSLGLEASRTISNIDLYDRESLALRLGVESQF